MTKAMRFRAWCLLILLFFLPLAYGLLPLSVSAQDPDSLPQLKPFEEIVKNTKKLDGLFTTYHQEKEGKIFLEIQPEQLDKNFLCITTLASGIGQSTLLRGMPLIDHLFYFQRVQDRLQFAVRNTNFRDNPGSPTNRSLATSFSDSVLYSLPIKSIHPTKHSLLVDLGDLLLAPLDFTGITPILPWILGASYTREMEKSYFLSAKAFPHNTEIETVYGFTATNTPTADLSVLPDSRAFNLRVRYSFSDLPTGNGYRPRLADPRIGYFITAYRDFSSSTEDFQRYINRWHIEKQNPAAPLSPPKQPITFWIENTVPIEYRDTIREGILLWNKAFEAAGFTNAIEAKQMPDNADWDPEDVRYNTIRWSHTYDTWFLGIGPSRVNPLTGQILDADIILDANLISIIKGEYRTLLQTNPTPALEGGWGDPRLSASRWLRQRGGRLGGPLVQKSLVRDHLEAARQPAIGALAASLLHNLLPNSEQMEEYVRQYLRFIVAHEVGHVLGLRHNFHGSTMLTLEELNDRSITQKVGLTASVMDYLPVNLAPPGVKQGDYFSGVIGDYDKWAIEYGYKPLNALTPEGEKQQLAEIAKASSAPELAYAPDEDSFDFLNPGANVFDLSSDILGYSQAQMENAREMWRRLDKRYPLAGESYEDMREKFNMVFSYYIRQVMNTTMFVAGQSFSRNHADSVNPRLPFEAISGVEQRRALALLQEYVFQQDAFEFPPELLNKLAPDRWYHWGTSPQLVPLDYPIGDRILWLHSTVLRTLLSPLRLNRLRDAQLKANSSDILTLAELFDTLQNGIWKSSTP
ncbi:zinc-dependent metalloprotease [[Phormidium] sp. ETS-05]|uniref:zinc-dependent metalloprotease n=1 Tax=[Phormidium] sp. ETS-05 TaxID=222819 RepID=UPI001E46A5C8|nr:zinc-dependent metalloprotease [[Phormidium] sp. ETS-05]